MNKQTTNNSQERGVALVMALLMILVLGLLAATVMFTSQAQSWTGLNYRLTSQSRYAAEAGVQNTMNWLASASYTAPTVFTSYDTTKNPVQCLSGCATIGGPIVLSATSGVSSNYPDSTVATAYNTALSASLAGVPNGSYSTTATLLRMNPAGGVSYLGTGGVMQTWQITSQGTVGGIRTATVQVVATYERSGTPVFGYGVEATSSACGAINFNGSDYSDSYNSSLGTYASQTPGTQGNIATNGNVNLGSGATIKGTIATGMAATVGACPGHGVTNAAGNPAVSPSHLTTALVAPLPWGCNPASPPCYPPGTKITTNQDVSTNCATISGCTKSGLGRDGTGSATSVSIIDGGSTTTANVFTLAPGSYGNLTIDNADVVHLSAGTYTVNSLNFARDGQIVVDSGPVTFQLVGNCPSGGGCPVESGYTPSTSVIWAAGLGGFNACGSGVTANPDVYGAVTCGTAKSAFSGVPSNFQVVYGGTYLTRVGGMPNAMVSYAPAAAYYAPGAPVGLYGSIVTATFDDESGSPFHYDTALQGAAVTVGQYRPIGGFNWSKF